MEKITRIFHISLFISLFILILPLVCDSAVLTSLWLILVVVISTLLVILPSFLLHFSTFRGVKTPVHRHPPPPSTTRNFVENSPQKWILRRRSVRFWCVGAQSTYVVATKGGSRNEVQNSHSSSRVYNNSSSVYSTYPAQHYNDVRNSKFHENSPDRNGRPTGPVRDDRRWLFHRNLAGKIVPLPGPELVRWVTVQQPLWQHSRRVYRDTPTACIYNGLGSHDEISVHVTVDISESRDRYWCFRWLVLAETCDENFVIVVNASTIT